MFSPEVLIVRTMPVWVRILERETTARTNFPEYLITVSSVLP